MRKQDPPQSPAALYRRLSGVTTGFKAYTPAQCDAIWPLIQEIGRLKAQKNAIILAHSYVKQDIVSTVADYVGDSLELSRIANSTDASMIVFSAVRFMAETAKILNPDKTVDFKDTSITQNTRVSYPIDHIDNIQPNLVGKNPKHIFFLTADAFGVLPPISKLTPGQAAYHFISGYTAKVAGTEAGITEPVPSFSACFGAPFMPLHPTRYGDMLSQKMKTSGVNVWLINTGWTGGPYGTGSRMKLKHTRAMITAALEGQLDQVNYKTHSIFNIAIPQSCPNVPNEVLNPRETWKDKEAYDAKAKILAKSFRDNFKTFEEYAGAEILKGAPKV